MNRRKQHLPLIKMGFHERRKRWVDRRHRSRLWGIIIVPFAWLKAGICRLLGLEHDPS